MATAVRELFPSAGIGFGPPIEDGFYYDFQVDRPFTPEDLERIEAKMAEVTARDYPFIREVVDRAEANRRFADDPLKLERISRAGRRRDHHGLHRRPVPGPLPRAAHPAHRPAQALQAAVRRRRLLAGRRAPPDAPADLRHGVVQEGGARRLPPPARGGAEARPPAARQGARPVHVPPVRPGRAVLDRPGHDDGHVLNDYIAEPQPARRATRRSRRRCCTTRGCGRSRGTGASTGRTCSWCSTRRPESTTSRSSR